MNIENAVNIIARAVTSWNSTGKNDDEEEYEHAVSDSIYTYLRGLCSIQAIERYDRHETEFKELLETKTTESLQSIIDS